MKHKHLTISALALILMAACIDAAGGTGVEPDDLAGTWTSTSLILTSVANLSMSMDLVAEEGATMTIVLGADGTYTFTFVSDVEPTENETGSYTVAGNIMTITPTDGLEETIVILRDGNTMTMTVDDEIVFIDGTKRRDRRVGDHPDALEVYGRAYALSVHPPR